MLSFHEFFDYLRLSFSEHFQMDYTMSFQWILDRSLATWDVVILLNHIFIVQPLVVMETICFLADSRRNGEQIRRMLWLAAALSPYTVIPSHHWTTRRTSSSDPPFWSSHWMRTSRGGKMRTFRTHLCFDWLCEKRSRNRRARRTGIVRLPCINSMSLIPFNLMTSDYHHPGIELL